MIQLLIKYLNNNYEYIYIYYFMNYTYIDKLLTNIFGTEQFGQTSKPEQFSGCCCSCNDSKTEFIKEVIKSLMKKQQNARNNKALENAKNLGQQLLNQQPANQQLLNQQLLNQQPANQQLSNQQLLNQQLLNQQLLNQQLLNQQLLNQQPANQPPANQPIINQPTTNQPTMTDVIVGIEKKRDTAYNAAVAKATQEMRNTIASIANAAGSGNLTGNAITNAENARNKAYEDAIIAATQERDRVTTAIKNAMESRNMEAIRSLAASMNLPSGVNQQPLNRQPANQQPSNKTQINAKALSPIIDEKINIPIEMAINNK